MIKKPVSKIVMLLLILTVIVLGTGFVFADSSNSVDAAIDNIVVPLTLQANSVQAGSTHTIDDIYNLLWYFFSSPSNLGPSFDTYFSYNGVYLSEIQTIIYQELGIIDSDINSGFSTLASNINLTNAKLEYVFSAIEDTINIKWYSTDFIYAGFNSAPNGQFIDHNTTGNDFYFGFNYNASINDTVPSLYRVFVPCVIQDGLYLDTSSISVDLKIIIPNVGVRDFEYSGQYFIENTKNGMYIYLYNMRWPLSGQYYIGVHSDLYLNAYYDFTGNIVSIPFDTIDYQLIKEAFNSSRSQEVNKAIQALASIYASDDVLIAKAAQQEYENEAIQDFTGSGSGAASKSDKNNLKSTSNALKSGLSSGGSVDNSLDVFNNNSSIWEWFTQPVSDSLDSTFNNPLYTTIYYDSDFSGTTSFNTSMFFNRIPANTFVYIDIDLFNPSTGTVSIYPFQTGFGSLDRIGFISSGESHFSYYGSFLSFVDRLRFSGNSIPLSGHLTVYSRNELSRSNSNSFTIIDFIHPNIEDIKNGQSSSERR